MILGFPSFFLCFFQCFIAFFYHCQNERLDFFLITFGFSNSLRSNDLWAILALFHRSQNSRGMCFIIFASLSQDIESRWSAGINQKHNSPIYSLFPILVFSISIRHLTSLYHIFSFFSILFL